MPLPHPALSYTLAAVVLCAYPEFDGTLPN